MATDLARIDAQDLESRLDIAKLHMSRGVVLARSKKYADAQKELSEASSDFDELLRLRPSDREMIRLSATTLGDRKALQGCVDGRQCKAVLTLRFPVLNN